VGVSLFLYIAQRLLDSREKLLCCPRRFSSIPILDLDGLSDANLKRLMLILLGGVAELEQDGGRHELSSSVGRT
jgi:hypothetical protein